MDSPTHKDAIMSLLSSCFPCRSEPPALPPSPRLQALLTDPESDSDAMSLHSTYRPHTRKKKRKGPMQLCGVNLFGKSRGQIRLEDEDTEPINRPRPNASEEPIPPRPRYDSDAAPLPDAAIQSLGISRSNTSASPTTPTQPSYVTSEPTRKPETPEEELARLRAEKAARKARRRDRRERKARAQLALESTADFEGYPGSGPFRDDSLPISPPSTTTSTPGIEELSDRFRIDGADPEDAEADMGAAAYTRSSARSALGSSSSSGTGTGTGTSASGRRSSLGPGFGGSNALGLGVHRGPPSPLVQSHLPTGAEVPARAAEVPTLTVEESAEEARELVRSAEDMDAPNQEQGEPETTKDDPLESVILPVSKAKAKAADVPEAGSSPLETKPAGSKLPDSASNSLGELTPKLIEPTKLPELSPKTPDSSPKLSESRPSPKLQIPPSPRPKIGLSGMPLSSPGAGPGPRTMENSPRLAQVALTQSPKTTGFGFPSPGLSRPGLGLTGGGFPSPGLGKSGLALGGGFPSPGLSSAGLNQGNSAHTRTGDGSGYPFGAGPGRKGSLTAGMGVALANRGD